MPKRLDLSQVRAVLFDVDGTLVDSIDNVVLCIQDTSRRHLGILPDSSLVRGLIGSPLRKQFPVIAGKDLDPSQVEEMVHDVIERIEDAANCDAWFHGALDALVAISEAGKKVALVTSKNAIELDRFLRRFHLAHLVDATVCASDVSEPKPSPESAYLACQLLGVPTADTLMIGDSVYDIRCAKAAGVAAIAVAYGSASKEALEAEEPEALFESPVQLREWVSLSLDSIACPAKS